MQETSTCGGGVVSWFIENVTVVVTVKFWWWLWEDDNDGFAHRGGGGGGVLDWFNATNCCCKGLFVVDLEPNKWIKINIKN